MTPAKELIQGERCNFPACSCGPMDCCDWPISPGDLKKMADAGKQASKAGKELREALIKNGNRLQKTVPEEVMNALNPAIQRLVVDLGVKEINWGMNSAEFVYKDLRVKINVTVKK